MTIKRRPRPFKCRCLYCGRVFYGHKADASFCEPAHFHAAQREWWAMEKRMAKNRLRPIPEETPHQRRNRLSEEKGARWRAEHPEEVARIGQEMRDALARLDKIVIPGLDDVEAKT